MGRPKERLAPKIAKKIARTLARASVTWNAWDLKKRKRVKMKIL